MGGNFSIPKQNERALAGSERDSWLIDPRSPTHKRTPVAQWKQERATKASSVIDLADPRSPFPNRTPLPSSASDSRLGERVAAIPLNFDILEPCVEEPESPMETETDAQQPTWPSASPNAFKNTNVHFNNTSTQALPTVASTSNNSSTATTSMFIPLKQNDGGNAYSSSQVNTIIFGRGDAATLSEGVVLAKPESRRALNQLTNARQMPSPPKGSGVFSAPVRSGADKRAHSNVSSPAQVPLRA